MAIAIIGFSEVLDILKGLLNGLKSAADLPEANRLDMRNALADTAELIDQAVTILKKHLATVVAELRFGDEATARNMVRELGDFGGWEKKYRLLYTFDALRTSLEHMQRSGIFNIKNKHFKEDAHVIYQIMLGYMGGDANLARSVSMMLVQLSTMSDTATSTRADVISAVERGRQVVGDWQQKFTDLEQQVRSLQ